jgi:hypothetical protein
MQWKGSEEQRSSFGDSIIMETIGSFCVRETNKSTLSFFNNKRVSNSKKKNQSDTKKLANACASLHVRRTFKIFFGISNRYQHVDLESRSLDDSAFSPAHQTAAAHCNTKITHGRARAEAWANNIDP